ncbi:hypothetical protein QJS04_geneDACA007462 [Acorus gramineus]|uniref:Uncharacterized protein n=1 Tax=Acorus gramineus TaxID=55184 RepID=A0AAV9B0P2_ACOGR|nr:hypothetical protein QJS04_geneDACA007462 [Acorus gramineus]
MNAWAPRKRDPTHGSLTHGVQSLQKSDPGVDYIPIIHSKSKKKKKKIHSSGITCSKFPKWGLTKFGIPGVPNSMRV